MQTTSFPHGIIWLEHTAGLEVWSFLKPKGAPVYAFLYSVALTVK